MQTCNTDTFMSADATGRHMLLHLHAHQLVDSIKHYLSCKAAASDATSACIVVPRRGEGTDWRPLLPGMKRIAQYPVGAAVSDDGSYVTQEALAVCYDAPWPQLNACNLNQFDDRPVMQLDGCISGAPARILLDSGAQRSFVSRSFAERVGIGTKMTNVPHTA
jgi:Aspartyl protease